MIALVQKSVALQMGDVQDIELGLQNIFKNDDEG